MLDTPPVPVAPLHVVLDTDLETALREHARDCWPEEACGLLFGRRTGPAGDEEVRLTAYRPGVNRACSETGFVLDPLAIARADHDFRASGLSLLGVFHTHPFGPALPSEADRQGAWPGLLQLILSTSAGGSSDLAGWFPDGGRLRPVALQIPAASTLNR